MNEIPKRDEIVRQAFVVFYKHGFHASGVDSLLADSGISKRTLYKYFRSKEELIQAAVGHYGEIAFAGITSELARRGGDARKKILTIFDLRREALEAGDFSGCFAINAGLEYAGKHPELESVCADFLKALEAFVVGLCKEARCRKPKILARQIMVLLQGTIVYGQSQRDPAIATAAKNVVKMLLKNDA
jgi:AcrR family transcriptional regulator